MKCPKCGYPQYCPCPACKSSVPEGKKPWIWIKGEDVKCAGCGFTQHVDCWQDEDVKQYKDTAEGFKMGLESGFSIIKDKMVPFKTCKCGVEMVTVERSSGEVEYLKNCGCGKER